MSERSKKHPAYRRVADSNFLCGAADADGSLVAVLVRKPLQIPPQQEVLRVSHPPRVQSRGIERPQLLFAAH